MELPSGCAILLRGVILINMFNTFSGTSDNIVVSVNPGRTQLTRTPMLGTSKFLCKSWISHYSFHGVIFERAVLVCKQNRICLMIYLWHSCTGSMKQLIYKNTKLWKWLICITLQLKNNKKKGAKHYCLKD